MTILVCKQELIYIDNHKIQLFNFLCFNIFFQQKYLSRKENTQIVKTQKIIQNIIIQVIKIYDINDNTTTVEMFELLVK